MLTAFLQFSKESATRRGEAFNVSWADADLVSKTIPIIPEKGSR
jgi:hypothetical protein